VWNDEFFPTLKSVRLHRNQKLTKEHLEKLNSIGAFWKHVMGQTQHWDVRFQQLMEYKEDIGD
jgi:hypothetical protein